MIKKLNEYKITSRDGPFINVECNAKIINTLVQKINELVDAVNNQQTQLNDHGCRLLDLQNRITVLDDPSYREAELELANPYAEQRKWIGKLCKFKDYETDKPMIGVLKDIDVFVGDNNAEYITFLNATDNKTYLECEPVKPDDDIIYKGE